MRIEDSIIKPLRPLKIGRGRADWNQWPTPTTIAAAGYPCERWYFPPRMIQVLSAVEVAQDKDGSSNGPEYHISISRLMTPTSIGRCDTNEAKWVLSQFGVDGAEEDNHVPNGNVRNFWRPVAEGLVGKECKCKAEEVVIRENKGDFVWRP